MASLRRNPNPGRDEPNREELLRMAISAAKAGNAEGARMMFQRVLADDKRNETAMLWLVRLATTNEERRRWLTRVLAVNPDNRQAREALDKLSYTTSAGENRTLLLFAAVAGALLVVVVLVIGAVFLFGGV